MTKEQYRQILLLTGLEAHIVNLALSAFDVGYQRAYQEFADKIQAVI